MRIAISQGTPDVPTPKTKPGRKRKQVSKPKEESLGSKQARLGSKPKSKARPKAKAKASPKKKASKKAKGCGKGRGRGGKSGVIMNYENVYSREYHRLKRSGATNQQVRVCECYMKVIKVSASTLLLC